MSEEETEPTWQLRTLKNAYQKREATQYIVDKFIATHSLNIVYGAPATMKSMLMADMCVHVVAGTNWLQSENGGIPVKKSPILWIDMDNGARRTDERFDAIGQYNNLPDDAPLHYVSMPDPTLIANDTKSIVVLINTIRETNASIVVIDNLGLITGDVEENSAQMARIMGNLREVAELTGCAIIIIHHARKGGAGQSRAGDALRGHSSIEASVDLALNITRDGDAKQITIMSTKTRGVDVPTLTAKFDYKHYEGTHDLERAYFYGVVAKRGSNPIRETILFYVEEHGEITKTRLVELVNENLKGEASKAKIRSFLDDMLNITGQLQAKKGEYNAQIISKK